jgi:hypothetical protein
MSKSSSTLSSIPDYISMDIGGLVLGHVCLNLDVILRLCVCMHCALCDHIMNASAECKSIESVQRNFRHVYGKHSGSDNTFEMHFVPHKETGSALRETSGTHNASGHDIEYIAL